MDAISRRSFVKQSSLLVALASQLPTILLTGCESQQTIADLLNTLGSAAEQLATYENNPVLASKLQTDIAAAASAVLNWKKGTASQMVIEALNLVEDDLDLFPMAGPYVALVDLAIGSVEAILVDLHLGTPTTSTATGKPRRQVHLPYKAPKNSKDFTAKWNALAPANLHVSK